MVNVLKADGRIEPFSEQKLRSSIGRAGIPVDIQEEVEAHVKGKLYDNITTNEIYHHIIEFLGNKSIHPYIKAKYSLKQTIMQLGPTGYPFEDFVAEILKAEGYTTQVRQILQGKCITHEVDVVAQKNDQTIMVEAKFHNQPGLRTDTHVALYTKARFDDLKELHNFSLAFLVTNTKVTTDVTKYAMCCGMRIISWEYPTGASLRELIDKFHLYPITALSSINTNQKQTLLSHDIVMCKDISDHPEKLDTLFVSKEEAAKILQEAKFIVQ